MAYLQRARRGRSGGRPRHGRQRPRPPVTPARVAHYQRDQAFRSSPRRQNRLPRWKACGTTGGSTRTPLLPDDFRKEPPRGNFLVRSVHGSCVGTCREPIEEPLEVTVLPLGRAAQSVILRHGGQEVSEVTTVADHQGIGRGYSTSPVRLHGRDPRARRKAAHPQLHTMRRERTFLKLPVLADTSTWSLTVLTRRCRRGDDDRGVQADHDGLAQVAVSDHRGRDATVAFGDQVLHMNTGPCPRGRDLRPGQPVHRIQGPPHRVRAIGPNRSLIPQRGQVRKHPATVGDRHRRVGQNPAAVMDRREAATGRRGRQPPSQPAPAPSRSPNATRARRPRPADHRPIR